MKNVTAYVHSHWDREWYREFEEFRLRLLEVFGDVLSALKNDELPCFYFDGQTAALEDYLEIYPEKLPLIKKLIKEKKLRIGPFYCSADSFLSSGECLYRNFETGIKKAKELGETEFIGYMADTFGHSKAVPYILKALNINKACLWRGLGNLPADLDWNGIETTYLIQGYFQDFLNSDLPIEKKAENLKKYLDKISAKSSDNVLLPIGADHLSIPKNLNKQIKELNNIYKDYNITVSTPFEYFKKVKKRKIVKGEFLDNSLNFILPGVYSSRIYLKQANCNAQWYLTRIAEPLQALAYFYYNTRSRQNEIDYAYKTIFKNHAHDSIYGCSTDNVHKEVMLRYKNIDIISDGIIKRTVRDLSDNTKNLAVINLSNFNYSGKVVIETENKLPKWLNAVKISSRKGFTDKKLYNINDIPITEDITDINTYLIDIKNIPAFSIAQIKQDNVCTKNHIKTGENYIENQNIKLAVKHNKIEITDKISNKTYKNFIKITDRADIGDSYNFGALKDDKPVTAKLIKYGIKENNHIRAVLSAVYEIKIPVKSTKKGRTKKTHNCKINIDFILYNQSKTVECEINWENKSENHILQIGFNLTEKITSTISEDLFGTVKRKFNPDYDIYKNIPAPKGKELKPNTAPMQRFVSAQGFLLITKGNTEYEINKNILNLTLLRATGIISNPLNSTRGTPAGPPIKTPELQCTGKNTSNIAIAFTSDECEMYKYTEEFYSPYIILCTDIHDKQFIKPEKNTLIYAVKTEDKKLIVRTFDTYKEKIKNIEIKH